MQKLWLQERRKGHSLPLALLAIAGALWCIGYVKGTSFTKLKAHSLHFLGYNLRSKSNYHALERNNDYGTKNRIYL